jgi:hypothetical protein
MPGCSAFSTSFQAAGIHPMTNHGRADLSNLAGNGGFTSILTMAGDPYGTAITASFPHFNCLPLRRTAVKSSRDRSRVSNLFATPEAEIARLGGGA